MTRTFWISLRQLKIHEFHKCLQHDQEDRECWTKTYMQLTSTQYEEVRQSARMGAQLFILYLILRGFSDDATVTVSIQSFSASVPSGLVLASASVQVLFLVLKLQSTVMIMLLRSAIGARNHRHGFSSEFIAFRNGSEDRPFTIPLTINKFIKPSPIIALPLTLALLICVIFGTAIPVVAIWHYLFTSQILTFGSEEYRLLNSILSAFGIFTLIYAVFFVLMFNIPLPCKKDSDSIRWGFLAPLYNPGLHRNAAKWLRESDAPE